MRIIHKALKVEEVSFQQYELMMFVLNTLLLAVSYCVQLLVSYCCDITDSRTCQPCHTLLR